MLLKQYTVAPHKKQMTCAIAVVVVMLWLLV